MPVLVLIRQALDEMGVTFDKLRDYLPMMTGLMEREEPDENPKPPETELEAKHPVVIIPGSLIHRLGRPLKPS